MEEGKVPRMMLDELLRSFVPSCAQETEDLRMMRFYMERFDDLLYRTNEAAHFTASSWIVNPARSRVLMAYHNIYDSWSWTGGHADGDGDLLQVALREAKEETGIERIQPVEGSVYSLEILTVPAHIKRNRYVVPHLHLNLTFLLEADDEQPIHCKPDENSAVRWFAVDEAVAASSEPDMRVIYQKLNDRLKQ